MEQNELMLHFPGDHTEREDARPAISVYLEHDGEDPPTLVSVIGGVDIGEWEIGREIVNAKGARRLTTNRLWRRTGDRDWRNVYDDPSDGPSRTQVQRGAIEPHLELVSDMLAEASSLHPDWAVMMESWRLTSVKNARGGRRKFDSADVDKRPDEDNDSWVADRLGDDVHWQTPAKRRWVDGQNALGSVPWAITPERLRELRESDDPSPGATVRLASELQESE